MLFNMSNKPNDGSNATMQLRSVVDPASNRPFLAADLPPLTVQVPGSTIMLPVENLLESLHQQFPLEWAKENLRLHTPDRPSGLILPNGSK